MIFQVLGTPNSEDLGFITDPKALRYVESFPPAPPQDLSEYFPAATTDELDLLMKLLTFSPRKRISLDEAIAHPYFD